MALASAIPVLPSLSIISNTLHCSNLRSSLSFPIITSHPKVGGLSIKCVRVGGVEIPNNKRVEFSLRYIHGIGRSISKQILCDIGMENKVTKELSEEELTSLRDQVSKYMIEGDLDWKTGAILLREEIQRSCN
ncbi:unnamed protein product [Cuscuta europaea]|uniref:Uncharacterized protein n=2 Tax=Cuscuta europaea TaxID=41803 RepID=A0A9P0Z663_CUSEU|nr:unnamed protein product [Cuscuta europaea]